jgi:hypothetical protein
MTVATLVVAWLPGSSALEPEGRHPQFEFSEHLTPNLDFDTPIYPALPVEIRESLMRSEVFGHVVFRYVAFEHRGPLAASLLPNWAQQPAGIASAYANAAEPVVYDPYDAD